MPYTKTKQVRESRRTLAEEVQKRSAARPLAQKIREAGAKELAKLIRQHGEEEINRHKEQQ